MDITSMFNLTGKTVVITGGAGHLGRGMSEALAAFHADLFILGKNEDKCQKYAKQLKAKYGLRFCEGISFDLDIEASIEIALDRIFSQTNRIDVLINNAAYSGLGEIENLSNEDWMHGMNGTINGVFRVTKYALRYMLKAGQGNIINIGSMYGIVSPDMGIYGNSQQNNPSFYGAGKAAIIQFTRYLACVYGKRGIRANAISPGPFPNKEVQENKEFIERLKSKTPMHRIGQPVDLQGIIVYLSSDASAYMTGQNISVDGGWTAW